MLKGKNKETCWPSQPKNPKPNKNEDHELERRDPFCSEIPEWLQEFRENLVDDRVRIWGKHSVYTHFPKDRNCAICQRTQNYKGPVQKTHWRSRTSCRKFWWFVYSRPQSSQWRLWISKQSSICSRGARSRHSCFRAKKASQETQRSLQKFLEPNRKPKVIDADNSMEFGKACEDLSWNHCTSTPHKSETNGFLKEQCAE